MARPLRIEYQGAWYHFTCRGNEKNVIFKDDGDRKTFLNILQESIDKYKVELHGYVLMDNHFHLILHTPLGNLNRFAQRFNTAYSGYYNRRHKRSGHLYQGRYKAVLVDKDSYLLELSRYIHLNPVRIHKVYKQKLSDRLAWLGNYQWSSNRGYGLKRYRDTFVCYSSVLGYLGGDQSDGRKRYRGFIEEGITMGIESPFQDVKGQVVLGEKGFVDWVYANILKKKKGNFDLTEQPRSKKLIKEIPLDTIVDQVCEIFMVERNNLLKRRSTAQEARMVLIELCCRYLLIHKSLREIGRELGGLTVGGMSHARKRLQERLKHNDFLRLQIDQCVLVLDKI
ncbi:MAG: transposase [Planctomycetia bacterium]|nr:transposase [Planctomycetia bacterium]